jgi:hypothetical protein
MQKSFLLKILPVVIFLGMTGLDAVAQYSIGVRGGVNISNYWGKYLNRISRQKLPRFLVLSVSFRKMNGCR